MDTRNTIIVPADKIPYLKSKSELFNVLISNNFKNSNNYFTKNGDYIIKKETIFPINNNSDRKLVKARNIVFEQLRKALMGERVTNENDAEYIKEYFMFNKDFNFFNPTLEEQPYIGRNVVNTKKNVSSNSSRSNRYELNNYSDYSYYNDFNNVNSEYNSSKYNKTKKNKYKNNVNIGNNNNNHNNYVMNLIKKAKKTYSKYPKSGKRPSKYNKYRATKKLYKD